jgi:CubicO group peptidase (beta-lactamase class C family)
MSRTLFVMLVVVLVVCCNKTGGAFTDGKPVVKADPPAEQAKPKPEDAKTGDKSAKKDAPTAEEAKTARQAEVSGKLDALFDSSKNAFNPLNGNVLAAENGTVIYQKSFGFADFQNKIPLSNASRFNIASISKTFTSVAILQLYEKGKLSIHDAVQKHLPEFPFTDISIKHLLSHTTGLPEFELFNDINDRIITNRDVLPYLKKWKTPLSSKPGEKWEYCSLNYNLLALIVEKISGQEFHEYLKKSVWSQAKMSDTYLLNDAFHEQSDKNRVINHQHLHLYSETPLDVDTKRFPFFGGAIRVSGLQGSTCIIATTNDLLKYDQALYGGVLLKQTTLEEAFTPFKLNNGEPAYTNMKLGKNAYGLGWFIFEDASQGKIVWHTGGIDGSLSIFLRNIDKKRTVILIDNADSNGVYQNGVNAMSILNGMPPSLIAKRSLAKEYGKVLVSKGIDAAFCKLIELKDNTTRYYLSEVEMNELGLGLSEDTQVAGHMEKSLEVLKLTTMFFPKSFNTYDSYGEVLAKIGKKDEAILMYRKSLELNPKSETAIKALEELTGSTPSRK